jgi:hypothetical protein
MGLTNYPNGIFATPNIGGVGRLADLFAADNIFFVDGLLGDAANDGKAPGGGHALDSLTNAVSAASKDGVIYIKPLTTTASAQTYYRDNVVFPLTKPNLSVIGCGSGWTNQSSVQYKVAAAATTSHLFDVRGAGLYLENMRLTGNSMTGTGSIIHANVSATLQPAGLHVRGCLFEAAYTQAVMGANPYGGSITGNTVNYSLIEDNWFYNTLSGVALISNYGTLGRVIIRNNFFSGAPASRSCDVYLEPGTSTYGSGVMVHGNVFSDGVPTGGTIGRFIKIVNATTGIVANNWFASTAAAAEYGSDGTDCVIPATFFFAGNYNEDGLIAGGT